MGKVTFDKSGNTVTRKEDTEWLRIWCEEVNDTSLPRVALIGDSITEGYYVFVKDLLKNTATVDYLATSYSIESNMYSLTVRDFINDSEYDVVHYNYGLHGFPVSEKSFGRLCKDLIRFAASKAKIIIATTTTVLDENMISQNACWKAKIEKRNTILVSVAKEFNTGINDLNSVCQRLDIADRTPDGVHFTKTGYSALAESVVKAVRTQLNKISGES